MTEENAVAVGTEVVEGTDINRMSRKQLVNYVKHMIAKQDRSANDLSVERGGKQVVIPEDMSWDELIEWAHRMREADEAEFAVNHSLDCHPLDGAYALLRAIKEEYGWSQMTSTASFFGSNPPVMVNMDISRDESIQVPWGRVKVPDISGFIDMGYSCADSLPKFTVSGKTLNKDKDKIHNLYKRAKAIIETNSVYHGKALRVNLEWLREGKEFNPDVHGFKFMDLSGAENLVFDTDTEDILDITLFALIEDAQAMRDDDVCLKRGMLLEGPYGVGKTLTAKVTAQKAVENGWTFMLCEDARDLEQVIHLARRYEPCVVFCEDIDRVILQKRTLSVDKVLNILDGVDSKNSELMCVLTTNHAELISEAMLRPGRVDTVLPLRAPNKDAAIRLVKQYTGDKLDPKADLNELGDMLDGKIPAVIREVVERSKIARIRRRHENIKADDLITAAKSMEKHLELLNKKAPEPTPLEKAVEAIGAAISEAISDGMNELADSVGDKVADRF